ncbi:MAG: type II/IV secretion system ATPase subunit [archaeon]
MGLKDLLKKTGKKLGETKEHEKAADKIQKRYEKKEERKPIDIEPLNEPSEEPEDQRKTRRFKEIRKPKRTKSKPISEIQRMRRKGSIPEEGGFVKGKKGEKIREPEVWDFPQVSRKIRRKGKEVKPLQEVKGGPGDLFQIPYEAKTKKISPSWKPPKLQDVDERYPLIEPWAYARLHWDEEEERLRYYVLEPPLTQEEKDKLKRVKELLTDLLDVNLMEVTERKKMREYLKSKLAGIIKNYEINLTQEQYNKILYYIYRDFLGLEKIEPLMHDPSIEDVSCDGVNIPIYIYHKQYGSIKTNIVYKNNEKLDNFVTKLAQRTGKHISISEPLLQGALPDGSRLQATYSAGKEISMKGSTFTIRKFTEEPLTIIDLMNFGTIPAIIGSYLWTTIEYKNSLLISGGTATGKTSTLNALSMFIPRDKKIISIEDTPEIQLPHEHWINKIATTTGQQGRSKKGEVSMFDLVKAGLRERPDELIVGEVRGEEAYNLFQGMATGHPGLSTMHADSVQAVINRLKTEPISLSPGLIQHLDVILILGFSRVGDIDARRIKKVIEVVDIDLETGRPITNELFSYIPSEDKFEFVSEESYLLKEIEEEKGIPREEIWEELQRRATVLKWMQENDIKNLHEVGEVIAQYQSEPERLMSKIKKEEVEE